MVSVSPNRYLILRIFGKKQEAIKAYEKAIELNPNHMFAHANLARTQKDMNNYQDSLQNFKKALEFDKNNKDIQKQIKELEKEVKKQPKEIKLSLTKKHKNEKNRK